jgi:hypothetical protein
MDSQDYPYLHSIMVVVPITAQGINAYQILPIYKNYETIGSTSLYVGHNIVSDQITLEAPKDVITTSPPEPVIGGQVWQLTHPNF